MTTSLVTGLVVGAVAVTAVGAIAGYKMRDRDSYAEVVNVKPITETIRTPREDCRDVEVTKQQPAKDEKRLAGTAIGAVVGGIIGHQVGSGRGNDAATVAGAAAGGYAGNRIQKNRQETNTYTTTEHKCETVYDKHEKQAGYDVEYRLEGRTGTVRMDHDPGTRIPVKDGQLVLN